MVWPAHPIRAVPALELQQHPARGFVGLICPGCAGGDEVITVDLHDLNTFRCQGCENEFTADRVREFLAAAEGWRAVLAWIDAAPVLPQEDAR
jgi:hypothetical protein